MILPAKKSFQDNLFLNMAEKALENTMGIRAII